METLTWLMAGDPAIKRLAMKYLLDQDSKVLHEGWIKTYLDLFDHEKKEWGKGIYSPKWISTFYTMRELTILEVNADHQIYQEGLKTLLERMWHASLWKEDDLCVVGMLLSMCVHAKADQVTISSLAERLMSSQLPDGGFNCEYTFKEVKSSSVHTTLTVLEGLSALGQSDNDHDHERRIKIEREAQAFLLQKHLMRRERDNALMFSYIDKFHYPTRWKYDVLRALVYFAKAKVPYDNRMDEAMDLLKKRFKDGRLPKGPTHTGRHHFVLDPMDIRRMNTLNGLIVLKTYDQSLYDSMIDESLIE